jgi:hypothetical protein
MSWEEGAATEIAICAFKFAGKVLTWGSYTLERSFLVLLCDGNTPPCFTLHSVTVSCLEWFPSIQTYPVRCLNLGKHRGKS